jgi:hypothetical protein
MWGSPVVSVVLWAVAVAAAVWILVPAIAFAIGAGGVQTEVLPEVGPPGLHDENSAFAPRLRELAALGFRAAGQTRERGRFISPVHWGWQAYEPEQWLASPDGRSYAKLYRLVRDEPMRISFVSLFDGGGIVRTSCPGPGGNDLIYPNYRRISLRGVDAAALLAAHEEHVEAFARERGVAVKIATVPEFAAAENAAEHPIMRKMGAAGYAFLLTALTPAVLWVQALRSAGASSSLTALVTCAHAGFYALVRWLVLGPILRQNARRSHTESRPEESRFDQPTDVAPDGTILATGKNERRLRVLAAVAALLTCVWPVALAMKLPAAARHGGFAIVRPLVFIAASVLVIADLVARARGKILGRKYVPRHPGGVWIGFFVSGVLFAIALKWGKGPLRHIVLVVYLASMLISIAGERLEKHRRT